MQLRCTKPHRRPPAATHALGIRGSRKQQTLRLRAALFPKVGAFILSTTLCSVVLRGHRPLFKVQPAHRKGSRGEATPVMTQPPASQDGGGRRAADRSNPLLSRLLAIYTFHSRVPRCRSRSLPGRAGQANENPVAKRPPREGPFHLLAYMLCFVTRTLNSNIREYKKKHTFLQSGFTMFRTESLFCGSGPSLTPVS